MKLYYTIILSLLIAPFLRAQSTVGIAQAQAWATQQQAAFEENKGQVWDSNQQPAAEVQYHYQNGGLQLFLLPTGLAYQFSRTHYPEGYVHHRKQLTAEELKTQMALEKQVRLETYRMDVELVGANPNANIVADGQSKDYVNYYNRQILNVRSFQKLTYQDIYPGIDWVLYTTEQGLKYDFVVHPGADPQQIQLRFKHHEGLKINADGSFTLSNRLGSVTEQAPVSFQGNQTVATAFEQESNHIRFKLDAYDPHQTLVIDPNLIWATYYGGTNEEGGSAIAVDANNNVYFSGSSTSNTNIAAGGHQNTYGGNGDAFLVKFDNSGVRQWATYYGGSLNDFAAGCAIGPNGEVYLVGTTQSSNNIASGGHQNTLGGGGVFGDLFLVQFNANGVRQWATYYGGNDFDTGSGCDVDANGNVYAGGITSSNTGIASGGHQNTYGGRNDAFLVKFNSSGVRQWATYYGTVDIDETYECMVENNHVYLMGRTTSSTGIASGGHQNTYGGNDDGFLVKFNLNGVRQWATYYGGTGADWATGGAVDANDNVFLVGRTTSATGIASGGHQNTYGGDDDAFLVKFNSSGVRQWATYYGGTEDDDAAACVLDGNGSLFVIGDTESPTNIAAGGHQNTHGGGYDAFVVKFDDNGVREWGSYFGTRSQDFGSSCAVDGNGDLLLSGRTWAASGIAQNGHQMTYGGGMDDAFLAKFLGTLCTVTGSTTVTACDQYTFANQTYTTSGVYTDTLLSIRGCDSVVTLNLTINNTPSNQVTRTSPTLTAQAVGANYQWFDCIADTIIPGATNQSFTPASSSEYAVAVSQNGCADTSFCYRVIVVGVDQVPSASTIQLYPNPTPSHFTLDLGRLSQNVTLQLHQLNGQLLREAHYPELQQTQWTFDQHLPPGVYVLKVTIDQQPATYLKVIKR